MVNVSEKFRARMHSERGLGFISVVVTLLIIGALYYGYLGQYGMSEELTRGGCCPNGWTRNRLPDEPSGHRTSHLDLDHEPSGQTAHPEGSGKGRDLHQSLPGRWSLQGGGGKGLLFTPLRLTISPSLEALFE